MAMSPEETRKPPEINPTKAYPTVPSPKVTVNLSDKNTRTMMNEAYSPT